MDIATIHCAMVRICDALALKHPEHALAYACIPWLLDAVFLAYFALTLWFGLRVQCVMLGLVDEKNPEPRQAFHPGDSGFKCPRKVLDDGSVIEARFSPRGELLNYELVRHGESIATIGSRQKA